MGIVGKLLIKLKYDVPSSYLETMPFLEIYETVPRHFAASSIGICSMIKKEAQESSYFNDT